MADSAVSVIIPTRDKAPFLERSLASWCRQEYAGYELVVVNDGSADHTLDVLSSYRSELPLRIVDVPHQGRARARNRGLEAAAGEVIVFVDDDRVVPPHFLAAHIADRDPADIVVGWQFGLLVDLHSRGDQSVSPQQLAALLHDDPWALATKLRDGRLPSVDAAQIRDNIGAIDALRLEDPWSLYLGTMTAVYGDRLQACPLAWTCGTTGNLSVSRRLLDEAGNFDEHFVGWGVEDTELHYRLAKAGGRTRVSRDAYNYHQNHPKDLLGTRRQQWARNATHFLRKHESLEIALYIHAESGAIPHVEACRMIAQAREMGETALLKTFRRLLMESALAIVTRNAGLLTQA